MKIAVMQPYFIPYIGYFQLMNAVDVFVVYDNIKFTKKGWINRNRILSNGKDEYVTLPLKSDSDYLDVVQRHLSDQFIEERKKLLRKIEGSYKKAPQFQTVFPLMERIMNYDDKNLFGFIHHSLTTLCDFLSINTEIKISSTVAIDHSLKSQEKVIAFCKALSADEYINPIGGLELYNRADFSGSGISLQFLQSEMVSYAQFNHEFVPWLSILDVLMFNSVEGTQDMLRSFKFV